MKANHFILTIPAVNGLAGTGAGVPFRINDDGFLTEAAAATVFVVDAETVPTPPVSPIFAGTTRSGLVDRLDAGGH